MAYRRRAAAGLASDAASGAGPVTRHQRDSRDVFVLADTGTQDGDGEGTAPVADTSPLDNYFQVSSNMLSSPSVEVAQHIAGCDQLHGHRLFAQLSAALENLRSEAGNMRCVCYQAGCKLLGLVLNDLHATVLEVDDALWATTTMVMTTTTLADDDANNNNNNTATTSLVPACGSSGASSTVDVAAAPQAQQQRKEAADQGSSSSSRGGTSASGSDVVPACRVWLKQLQDFVLSCQADIDLMTQEAHGLGQHACARLWRDLLAMVTHNLGHVCAGVRAMGVAGKLPPAAPPPPPPPTATAGSGAADSGPPPSHGDVAPPAAPASAPASASASSSSKAAAGMQGGCCSRPVSRRARLPYTTYWARKIAI